MFRNLLIAFFILLTEFPLTAFSQKDSLNFSLDEIVVTGTRAQVNRNNVPMTISVINRNDIEESSESALLPALSERIPGMFVTERGVTGFGVSSGGSGGITLRGVGGSPTTGVLVLIDGHPQYMGIMGHHLPDAYVASDVERVEVVRGPASILYGSNAMGGAINIITRKQNQDGWSTNGRLMYGSYHTQKYMLNGGLKQGKFDIFASVNHDRTDGHRNNSGFRITNAYTRAGYGLSEYFRVWGDVSVASFTAQNPGTMEKPMFDNIADIVRGVASVTLENNYGQGNGALKLFYNFGDHHINEGYAEGGNPRDFRFRSKDNNFGAILYQIFRPVNGNEITAGIDFKSYGGRAWNDPLEKNNPDDVQVDTTTYEVAGYAIMQQTLFEKLTLNIGLRYEYSRAFGGEWVPQAGLAYRPYPYTALKASVSKGFRSPTIRELYYKAPWAAANPDLEPERLTNYEVSVGQSFLERRLSVELTGYVVGGNNLIQVQSIDGGNKNVNTGKFNNKGMELSFKWQVMKNVALQGNYSYLHMDEPVAYAPEQQLFLAASYRFSHWNISANYQYIKNMYSVTGTNPTKESYGLVNAKTSYRLLKSLNLFVTGENLTNKDYTIMAGYPMPGITVLGGVNLYFSGK